MAFPPRSWNPSSFLLLLQILHLLLLPPCAIRTTTHRRRTVTVLHRLLHLLLSPFDGHALLASHVGKVALWRRRVRSGGGRRWVGLDLRGGRGLRRSVFRESSDAMAVFLARDDHSSESSGRRSASVRSPFIKAGQDRKKIQGRGAQSRATHAKRKSAQRVLNKTKRHRQHQSMARESFRAG
jgi:hypothetical protein